MKQVMESYGVFVLEALVVSLLLVLLFTQITDKAGNKGVLKIIGAGLETEGADYGSYTDFDVYQAESAKSAPIITYDTPAALKTGSNRLADYIKATDYAGGELPIKVISVQNPAGADVTVECDEDTVINLTEPGIYKLTVSAVDDGNRLSTCEIKIAVNK